jgi:ribosome-binding factor A
MLRDISQIMEQELAEQFPGMVTFTRVKLTDDLHYARVYYSYLGDGDTRPGLEEYLARERGRIRSLVGKNLRVRNIPELDFRFDPSIEEGIRIEQLLNEIKNEHRKD